ncbi:MAG: DUF5666 domain-containing protein, partial [Anaerolineales bacterium]
MSNKRYHEPRPTPQLVAALEVCLGELQKGTDLETILGLYQALAVELRPLLEAAQIAQRLHTETVPAAAMNRSRTRTLGRVAELRKARKPKRWARIPRVVFSAALLVLVFIAGWVSIDDATTRALPGDQLYPLKLNIENVWLEQVPNPQAQHNLEESYRQRRLDEVRQLFALLRIEQVAFQGVVNKMDPAGENTPEKWIIEDIPVVLDPNTLITGKIRVGMLVEVEGETTTRRNVLAATIRPRASSFVGIVENIAPDVWQVGGTQVSVLPTTEIEPGIAVGDAVTVLAQFDDQGNISARAILHASSPDSPPPSGVSPTPTPTAEPTVAGTPAPTASATVTPGSTLTSTSTLTPTPTLTPLPTRTPSGGGDAPTPTETGGADETEEPADTPEAVGPTAPTTTPTPSPTLPP